MNKPVEYFIAQRTSAGGERGERGDGSARAEGGAMLRVASIAIALSIAVMILTLAVIFGFKGEVHSRLRAISGDIIISTTRGVNPSIGSSILEGEQIEGIVAEASNLYGCEVARMSPYATSTAIITSYEGVEGVLLKGLDRRAQMEIFERGVVEGEIPDFGAEMSSRNVILSQELASQLGYKVGDRIDLLTTSEQGEMRRDIYRVGAIYSAGAGLAERSIIVTDIRNVQRLNRWSEDQVSGYEVTLNHLKRGKGSLQQRAKWIAEQINQSVIYSDEQRLDGVAAYDAGRIYVAIYDWLSALDINAVIVIAIMMVVAIFNIVTALLILVLERVQMIGILKALGMNNGALQRLFIYRALSITIRSLAWGNGVALALAFVQRQWRVIKLDEAGYLMDAVPIELSLWWIVALNVGVFVTILAVVAIPTRLVSSVEPHKAIKYQ